MIGAATLAQKQTEISHRVRVNNGKVVVRLIREADPDGVVTEHQVTMTNRLVDLLQDSGVIDSIQHQAATILRDLYERSKLSFGRLGASDPGRPFTSGGSVDFIRTSDDDEIDLEERGCFGRYNRAMQQVGQWRKIIRYSAIDDRHPSEFGAKYRCNGASELRAALDALARHFGLGKGRGR